MENEKSKDDDVSFLKDAIASSGEVLQPQPRAIFGKARNPNVMSILSYRGKGYGVVRYTSQGGKPMEFDVTDEKDFDTMQKLIAKAPLGAKWRVLRYEPPVPKKTKKKGKSYAPGFTTASDHEDEPNRQSNCRTATSHAKKPKPKSAKGKVGENQLSGKKGQRKAVTQASNPKNTYSKKKVEKKVSGKKNTNRKQSNAKTGMIKVDRESRMLRKGVL